MSSKISIELSEGARSKLGEIKSKLLDKGIRRGRVASLVNRLIEDISDKQIEQFVFDSIPLEHKVKVFMDDPVFRKRIEKLVNSK